MTMIFAIVCVMSCMTKDVMEFCDGLMEEDEEWAIDRKHRTILNEVQDGTMFFNVCMLDALYASISAIYGNVLAIDIGATWRC